MDGVLGSMTGEKEAPDEEDEEVMLSLRPLPSLLDEEVLDSSLPNVKGNEDGKRSFDMGKPDANSDGVWNADSRWRALGSMAMQGL